MSKCSCFADSVPVLDEMAGETACSKCGQVLDSFMEQPGQHDNYAISGNRMPSTEVLGDKRMRRASQICNNVDQTKLNATYMAKSCCAKIGMPQVVAERAIFLFDKFRRILRSKRAADMAAAVIYMACREHGVTRSLKEVSFALNANPKGARRVYGSLYESMDAKLPIQTPTGFATRLASDLELPEKTARKALGILKRLNASGRAEGHNPILLAVYATYVALDGTEDITQNRIAKAARISSVGLRLLIKKFGQACAAS